MTRSLFAVAACLVLASAVAQAPAADKPDPETVRKEIAPSVCTVTVENAWGVVQSISTGWLLGNGGFVVADLGSVKARGAARAVLTFPDGTKASADQFAMADPALGLVALKVDAAASRKGLPLASDLPSLGTATLVAMTGHAWGEQLDVSECRLLPGPKIQSVASRSGVTTPEGVDSFLRIEGDRIRAASGAPVTDADGQMLAVHLDVAARGMTSVLAMPATTLRTALLSSKPELKPLAELPEPFWPVRVLRLPGEPTSLETFAKASQTITRALVCDRCGGKGKIDPGAWIFDRDYRCPACMGTGLRLTSENMEMLAEWALQGTRVAWGPGVDSRTRSSVRKIGVEMLARLATVGRHLRRALGLLGKLGTVTMKDGEPTGVILYAEVEKEIEGPDGTYLLLDSFNARTPVAVRAEDLVGAGGLGPLPGRQVPKKGTWFALAATAVSHFRTGEVQGVYVLPFEWAPYIPSLDPNEGDDDRRGPPDWRDWRGPGRGGWGGRGGGGRGR